MIQLILPGAWNAPRAEPKVYHMNTREAEKAAARKLGKGWREKGYRVEDR